jgi:hypothetical protein
MDLIGLVNNTIKSVTQIDKGRKGLRTDGQEHEGRLYFEEGIASASNTFSQALSTGDPQVILATEEAFIEQELKYCSDDDIYSRSSLTQALQSFEDAFLCFESVVDQTGYKAAEKTWPHTPKYRVKNYPKDAFHLACISHRTRLQNVLRAPGINMIEKTVLEQRAANMTSAQTAYLVKQKECWNNKVI